MGQCRKEKISCTGDAIDASNCASILALPHMTLWQNTRAESKAVASLSKLICNQVKLTVLQESGVELLILSGYSTKFVLRELNDLYS